MDKGTDQRVPRNHSEIKLSSHVEIVTLDSDSHNNHVDRGLNVCQSTRDMADKYSHNLQKQGLHQGWKLFGFTGAWVKITWFDFYLANQANRANRANLSNNLVWQKSDLKRADLIFIKGSQGAFDCPMSEDLYHHTPSVHGRPWSAKKHAGYQMRRDGN